MSTISIEETRKRNSFLVRNGLDFNVSKRKLHLYDTLYSSDYNDTEFYCTVNDDTKAALGPVRSRYTVMQNNTLLDIVLEKIGEGNYDLENSRGGTFDKGRKVYMFIKYNMQTDWGQEQADCYVYALSSHDGSLRLTFGVSNKIHSCSNMFSVLMSDKDNNHIVKHTKRIESIGVDGSLKDLIRNNLLGISNLMRTMQNHILPEGVKEEVMELVVKKELKRANEKHTQRRRQLELRVRDEMEKKGYTYYGLFNGITNYLTHSGNFEETDVIYGTGNKLSQTVIKHLIKDMKDRGCLN